MLSVDCDQQRLIRYQQSSISPARSKQQSSSYLLLNFLTFSFSQCAPWKESSFETRYPSDTRQWFSIVLVRDWRSFSFFYWFPRGIKVQELGKFCKHIRGTLFTSLIKLFQLKGHVENINATLPRTKASFKKIALTLRNCCVKQFYFTINPFSVRIISINIMVEQGIATVVTTEL